jgi:hypothetical protein
VQVDRVDESPRRSSGSTISPVGDATAHEKARPVDDEETRVVVGGLEAGGQLGERVALP